MLSPTWTLTKKFVPATTWNKSYPLILWNLFYSVKLISSTNLWFEWLGFKDIEFGSSFSFDVSFNLMANINDLLGHLFSFRCSSTNHGSFKNDKGLKSRSLNYKLKWGKLKSFSVFINNESPASVKVRWLTSEICIVCLIKHSLLVQMCNVYNYLLSPTVHSQLSKVPTYFYRAWKKWECFVMKRDFNFTNHQTSVLN